MQERLTIGRVAKLTGLSTQMIRYYENAGVLPIPLRNQSRYRLYSNTDVRRVELVRRARLLDMSFTEVRELVERANDTNCNAFQDHFRESVRRKMEEVERRIADLQALKDDLTHLEAHLAVSAGDPEHEEHPMLACSPETCTCLGSARRAND